MKISDWFLPEVRASLLIGSFKSGSRSAVIAKFAAGPEQAVREQSVVMLVPAGPGVMAESCTKYPAFTQRVNPGHDVVLLGLNTVR